MINHQILEYIKVEQQKNTDKQVIINSLLANGWNNTDIQEAYSSLNNTNNTVPIKKNVWIKTIPTINTVFLIIYIALLAFVDYPTYIENVSRYSSFWNMMLGVFGAFVCFYLLEFFVFRNSFKSTASKFDNSIRVTIILRNLLVLLNVIPFIQLLGLGLGYFAGPVIVIVYIVLIIMRYTKKPPMQAQMVS